jgi:ribosomal 30S subunit maturation factor RimM
VGTVQEVFGLEPTDLLEVRRGDGTLLIPFTRQVVVDVDREAKVIRIDPPEGLLDL